MNMGYGEGREALAAAKRAVEDLCADSWQGPLALLDYLRCAARRRPRPPTALSSGGRA